VLAAYGLLAVVMLGGLLHTDVFDFVQHNVRNLLMYVLIIPMYFYVRSLDTDLPGKLARLFVIAGVFLSAFGIMSFFFFGPERLWGGIRVYSLMGNPNTFGLFLILPSLIAWSVILQRPRRKLRLLLIAAILLNLAALVLSISFQATATFVAAMCLMAVWMQGRRAIYGVVGIALVCAVAYAVITSYYQPFVDMYVFKMEDPVSTSYTGRLDQLSYVMDRVAELKNWFVGVYEHGVYERFDSQYYNIFVNNGMFALVLYMLPPVLVVYLGVKAYRRVATSYDLWHRALFASSVVFLFATITLTANLTAFMQRFPINMYYFLLIAVVLDTSRRVYRAASAGEPVAEGQCDPSQEMSAELSRRPH